MKTHNYFGSANYSILFIAIFSTTILPPLWDTIHSLFTQNPPKRLLEIFIPIPVFLAIALLTETFSIATNLLASAEEDRAKEILTIKYRGEIYAAAGVILAGISLCGLYYEIEHSANKIVTSTPLAFAIKISTPNLTLISASLSIKQKLVLATLDVIKTNKSLLFKISYWQHKTIIATPPFTAPIAVLLFATSIARLS